MDIIEYEVVPCNSALVGYNGHRFVVAGIIPLTVFTLPYRPSDWIVMNMPSLYNVILGRPQIHKFRAMPFHLPPSASLSVPLGNDEIQEKSRACTLMWISLYRVRWMAWADRGARSCPQEAMPSSCKQACWTKRERYGVSLRSLAPIQLKLYHIPVINSWKIIN